MRKLNKDSNKYRIILMIALPFMVAAIAITAIYFYYQSEDTKLSSSVTDITTGLSEDTIDAEFYGNYICLDYCRSYNAEFHVYKYKVNNFISELKSRLVAQGYDIVAECPEEIELGGANWDPQALSKNPNCSGDNIIRAEKNNTKVSISFSAPNEKTDIGKERIFVISSH